jgi:hypothetical protein
MSLIDGIKTFRATQAPEFHRDMRVVLIKRDLMDFCRDHDRPLFRVEGVPYQTCLEENKGNLNVLFTWFTGLWVMAFDDAKGGVRSG